MEGEGERDGRRGEGVEKLMRAWSEYVIKRKYHWTILKKDCRCIEVG